MCLLLHTPFCDQSEKCPPLDHVIKAVPAARRKSKMGLARHAVPHRPFSISARKILVNSRYR